MNELMGRFVTDRGAEAAAARIVVDAILTMLVMDDPVDSIHAAIDLLPGTGDAIQATRCNTDFGNSIGNTAFGNTGFANTGFANTSFGNTGFGNKDFDGMLGVMGAEWRRM